MHDDLFVIVKEILGAIPQAAGFVVLLLLLSIFLTWMKWSADKKAEEIRRQEEHPDLPQLCGFPLCGKPLDSIPKHEWDKSKSCDVLYCSSVCRKRDWKENNHHSVAILLSRRAQQLAQQREQEAQRSAVHWSQQLFDLIPDPNGAYSVELETVFDNLSKKVEMDAAKLTARTFCSAYMKKFGLAVHMWARECYGCCGKGCILIHLSERAMEESSGAPLSYVQHRLLLPLDDYALNKLIREYDPDTQVVLYILQRGVEKKQLAFPVCFSVYDKERDGPRSQSSASETRALAPESPKTAPRKAGKPRKADSGDGAGSAVGGEESKKDL